MTTHISRVSITFILFLSYLFSSGQKMDFETYDPPSTLVVDQNPITKARFPFVDVHSHQWNLTKERIGQLTKEMEEINMAVMVNLSGRGFNRTEGDIDSQQYMQSMMARTTGVAPGHFLHFTNVSFKDFGSDQWEAKAIKELEEDVKAGAAGLKIYKSLGLTSLDIEGKRIPVDDERLDPIWQKCGELKIPVLIHSADPEPFWQTMDSLNERWLELKTHPGRKRGETNPAPWQQIISEQHNVFRKHPETTFINAHMGWMANDLKKLGAHLDEFPNVYVGIGAVIAELGRQPRTAYAFMVKYQDRVLFAKDAYNKEEFYTYFRVLETTDEYFPYYKKYHAFWRMYGLGLPDDVLKKIYYQNAMRIISAIDPSLFPK